MKRRRCFARISGPFGSYRCDREGVHCMPDGTFRCRECKALEDALVDDRRVDVPDLSRFGR